MADFKHCDFLLLRYVPDVVKNEPINIGVVLLEENENGFTGVRFTSDWRRVRCADPDVDIELLESYEAEIQRLLDSRVPAIINYRGPMSRRDWLLAEMQQSLSGALELAPIEAILAESPQAELGKLAHIYLESAARAPRAVTGRRAIVNAMRTAFENAGVWDFMWKDIAVAKYTGPGDPLKIDCGYRPNDVIHLFHGLSFATGLDPAKALAFTYNNLRHQLPAAEAAEKCTLTAIMEDDLDVTDQGFVFALAMLQQHDIDIAEVRDLPQIAERARLDLKL